MVLKCPSCGKDIKDEEAIYCSYCSKPLKQLPFKQTGFPIAGGILAIIASCVCIIIGLVYLIMFQASISYVGGQPRWECLFAGLFGIIAFAFGLAGGITSLRRKNFKLAIIGVCFALTSGFVNFGALGTHPYSALLGGLIFGLPIIILSLLSLIFIAISKGEFS